jgi:uncharacterized protein
VILPDVNVLLNAFRTEAPEHQKHEEWLGLVLGGEAAYGMSPQVLCSVIRIATNRQIYAEPASLDLAIGFTNAMLDRPNCQIVQPGPRHWDIFTRLCREAKATGNLVSDVWFAALAIESGCEWITHDRDFAKLPGLRWRPPF